MLAPLLPPPAETGRHRCWPMRELMNAIFFVLRGGCAWRMLPEHFPPHQTVYRWFTPVPTTEPGKTSTTIWRPSSRCRCAGVDDDAARSRQQSPQLVAVQLHGHQMMALRDVHLSE